MSSPYVWDSEDPFVDVNQGHFGIRTLYLKLRNLKIYIPNEIVSQTKYTPMGLGLWPTFLNYSDLKSDIKHNKFRI